MKKRVEWITKTAIMVALLVVLQAVTRGFGQFVTGSCVNFVLAMSVLVCGIASAITVAIISPFFAFFFGIGPAFLPIVPAVCVGNGILILSLWLILKNKSKASFVRNIFAVISSSLFKFLALYSLIVKVVLPLLSLKEKQAQAIAAAFSWPQLVTAVIGCSLALVIVPRVKKAISM